MINSDFEHYFRLSLNRDLTGLEEITLFVAVSKVAVGQILSNQRNMGHKIDVTTHHYDIGLSTSINTTQAETIFSNLKLTFPNDNIEYSIA